MPSGSHYYFMIDQGCGSEFQIEEIFEKIYELKKFYM